MDRDTFLDRVRSSIGAATLPDSQDHDPGPLLPGLPPVDLVERFTEAVEAVSGTVHIGDPLSAIAGIVAKHGPGPFIAWDDDRLPVPGAAERLPAAGCEIVSSTVPVDPDGRRRHQRGYVDVRYGLTGAEAGFAESGSIVVRSGPGRPRMASLIPLIHIAFLPADHLFRSPVHWITGPDAEVGDAANVVYITGPSRTADIEQQLNLGVHGPREVHVILV